MNLKSIFANARQQERINNSLAYALYQVLITLRQNNIELSQECLELLNALEDKYKEFDTKGSEK